MAVPVACQHGAGLRAGRDQGRQGHLLERHAEVAFRAATGVAAHARRAGRQGARDLDAGAGLLRPQRRRRRRDGRRGAGQGGRQAGARAIHARPGHRLGPEGPGLDPPARAPRSTPPARSSPTSSSARASRASTSTPTAASRTTRWRARRSACALKSGDGFGVPAESYEFANKRTGVGDDPAAARPRLAAAHVASARSGRAADPLRQRIVHGRGGGGAQPRPDRVPAAAHQGSARHRA